MTPVPASSPIVIKIGGGVLDNLAPFWPQVRALMRTNPVVIVHGGGSTATALARKLGHRPRIIQGRRVTTPLDLQIVEWTMRGEVNLKLVGQAHAAGLQAAGLSGADGGTLMVTRRKPWIIDGETVDFGWVGDVDSVNPSLLQALTALGIIPIVAPIGIDADGQRYNVNADTVAGAIATALHAETLLLVTDTGGIRHTADDADTLLHTLNEQFLRQGQAEGWITDGMHVKGYVAIEALKHGVGRVFITHPEDLITRTRATRIVL